MEEDCRRWCALWESGCDAVAAKQVEVERVVSKEVWLHVAQVERMTRPTDVENMSRRERRDASSRQNCGG